MPAALLIPMPVPALSMVIIRLARGIGRFLMPTAAFGLDNNIGGLLQQVSLAVPEHSLSPILPEEQGILISVCEPALQLRRASRDALTLAIPTPLLCVV